MTPLLDPRTEALLALIEDPAMRTAVRVTFVMGWCSGLCPRITSTVRTRAEQQALWDAREDNPYPVAPPGTSLHETGQAWDSTSPDMEGWVRLRRLVGWRVPDRDPVHAEWTEQVAATFNLGSMNGRKALAG